MIHSTCKNIVITYMIKTNLSIFYYSIKIYSLKIFNNQLRSLSLNFLSTLLGFFMANCLTTILGQTGDWSITRAAIIVSFYEIISMEYYTNTKYVFNFVFKHSNNLKIGIVYGFFIDAFKLGS